MSDKQEVNLGCPYGPSRPEPWPGKNPVVANVANYQEQIGFFQDQLAAKDAEIAELRAERDASKNAAVAAMRSLQEMTAQWDEARECVGRLYKALNAFNDIADYDCKGNSLQCAARDEFSGMWEALAATPEHLRNA